jgi:hypothetical protein
MQEKPKKDTIPPKKIPISVPTDTNTVKQPLLAVPGRPV